MYISNFQVKPTSNVNFQARISDRVDYQLRRQLRVSKSRKKHTAMYNKKLEELKSWGLESSEIVITKNSIGNFTLGLSTLLDGNMGRVCWPFEHLPGKSELSQFVKLQARHIYETEKTIDYMYKTRGINIFKKFKSL